MNGLTARERRDPPTDADCAARAAGGMAGIAARGFVTWAGLGCGTGLGGVGGFIMGAAEGTAFGATEGFVRGGLTTGTWAGARHEAALGAGMGFLIGGPLGAIFHQICFTAGTQVHSAAGNRPIEALRVGRRALTEETKDDAGEPGDDPTAVDPATWRLVRLQTAKPAGSDNLVDAELLRPLAWIEQSRAVVGSQIHFELAELGIHGPADVLAIEPCPEIEPGRGRVITGTFTTARCQVLQLRLPNGEILEPTPPHRFYSETRQDWVAAQDLRIGECFRTRSGQAVTLESSGLKPGLHRVYNLEVEQEHQFYVSETGVLVHNAYNGSHLPSEDHGAWVGERGNSNFRLNEATAQRLGLEEGTVVPFRSGRADFSEFSFGDFNVKGLTGYPEDMPLIRRRIAEEFGFFKANGTPNENAARRWLRENNLTPNHAGGDLVQLIDSDLHRTIRHTGGAADLRNSY